MLLPCLPHSIVKWLSIGPWSSKWCIYPWHYRWHKECHVSVDGYNVLQKLVLTLYLSDLFEGILFSSTAMSGGDSSNSAPEAFPARLGHIEFTGNHPLEIFDEPYFMSNRVCTWFLHMNVVMIYRSFSVVHPLLMVIWRMLNSEAYSLSLSYSLSYRKEFEIFAPIYTKLMTCHY